VRVRGAISDADEVGDDLGRAVWRPRARERRSISRDCVESDMRVDCWTEETSERAKKKKPRNKKKSGR